MDKIKKLDKIQKLDKILNWTKLKQLTNGEERIKQICRSAMRYSRLKSKPVEWPSRLNFSKGFNSDCSEQKRLKIILRSIEDLKQGLKALKSRKIKDFKERKSLAVSINCVYLGFTLFITFHVRVQIVVASFGWHYEVSCTHK